jgi:signal transduction histidine kinase
MISRDETVMVKSRKQRTLELDDLRARLAEAEATLSAIRNGEVDALIVSGESGEKVYTLQGAETPYRELVENMSEGALSVDPTGVILYANRRFADMVRRPLERVVGARLAEFDAGGSLMGLIKDMEALRSSRREAALLVDGGETMPVFVSGSRPEEDTSGRVCVVLTDLTTQKHSEALQRAEEDARRHRDMAEKRAAELARSNADLETFAYAASHDLKEPLRGIASFAQFIIEDHGAQLDEAAREKVDTIVRLSGRMHALLDALLDYSRVGRSKLVHEAVALTPTTREVLETLTPFLREHRARVLVQPEMPSCLCDHFRISRLLTNLVTNAVKYNSSESKLVEISARTDRPGFVTLCVKDNGIGIDPRHHERIFGMFRRLHGRDAFGGGSGIGLSLVKIIAEQHGGQVWVESELGKGSTFYVTLPEAPATTA